MKAEKVLGIVACAIACASGSAFANSTTNWFGAVGSDATIVLTEATTNGVDVSVSGGVITLDGEAELTFTPTVTSPARSDNLVTISTSAVLTPNAVSDLPPSSELVGAQVGFAVAYDGNNVTNYYYYANDGWGKGAGTPPVDPTESVTFTITLDYRTNKAKFEVGDVVVTNNVPFVGTQLSAVAARGSGSLTEVNAKYEIAVAEYDNVKYGSVSDAMAAAGSANYDAIAVVDDAGSSTGGTGEAANGLEKWECAALQIDEAEQVALAKSAKQNAGKITLAVQNVTPESGLTVKYGVSVDGGAATGSYDADDIQIPMGEAAGSHTYKIVPTITATAN